MSKTKTFERGHFWSNFVQTFFIWCQITKILRKIFFFTNWSNIGCFWWICLWKLMKGWSEISEIHTTDASCHAPKKTRKRQISPDSPSLWILHLKYINIFTSWRYWVEIFGTEVFGEHSTRPQDYVRFIVLKM